MNFKLRNFDLPENIFYFLSPMLDPLSIVLDWDTRDKFYFNLLNRYFADVLNKPNNHSLVLAKPNESTYFHKIIPAFDIKYIKHCFDLKDFPDPTEYLIKNSCPINYNKQDIIDCWIHQTKTWSDLIPVLNNDNDARSEISAIKSYHRKNHDVLDSDSNDSSDSNQKYFHISSSTALIKKHLDNEDSQDSNIQSHYATSSTTLAKSKNTRLPYTLKEDVEIVKYIIKNKHAFDITGRQMWQKMEHANICKIRSWQSMKERYVKHIKYELKTGNSKFPFLNKNDLKVLRQGLNIDLIKKQDKEKLKSNFQDERIDEWVSDNSS